MNRTMPRFTNHGLTIVIAMTLLLAGCKSSPGSSAAATAESGSGAQASGKAGTASYVATPLSNQLTTATITDPSLNNIVAATLTIPAGWKLQGIEMISPCTFSPWPVFRSYSPDGLMQYRIEPVFGWRWRPNVRGMDNTGCANISGPMSAASFLQYYLGTMPGGVHVVGAMAVPSAYQQWAQGLAANSTRIQSTAPAAMRANNTADTAALRIEVVNGTFVVEERLRT